MNSDFKLNPLEAPEGFRAVLKSEAKNPDGRNICEACDWRHQCQDPTTDFESPKHRCVQGVLISGRTGKELFREDGCGVVFKKLL